MKNYSFVLLFHYITRKTLRKKYSFDINNDQNPLVGFPLVGKFLCKAPTHFCTCGAAVTYSFSNNCVEILSLYKGTTTPQASLPIKSHGLFRPQVLLRQYSNILSLKMCLRISYTISDLMTSFFPKGRNKQRCNGLPLGITTHRLINRSWLSSVFEPSCKKQGKQQSCLFHNTFLARRFEQWPEILDLNDIDLRGGYLYQRGVQTVEKVCKLGVALEDWFALISSNLEIGIFRDVFWEPVKGEVPGRCFTGDVNRHFPLMQRRERHE